MKRTNGNHPALTLGTTLLATMITLAWLVTPSSQAAPDTTQPVVGTYYYPWYSPSTNWRHVMREHLVPAQTPKLGHYSSNDPKIISDHIAQTLQAGINFWAVSWWGPGTPTDKNFLNAILKHPDAGKLKYAALYEATGRMGRFGNPDYSKWIADLEYLRDHFFNNPNYLHVEGKPVVFVYLTREYFRNKGADVLKETREKFPELYLVGDEVFGEGYRADWAKNFDAITAYDVYGQSVGRFGGTKKAIHFLADNYRHARQQANSVGTAFMPTIAPGYNDTAVRKGHPGRARYFTDVEGSKEGDLFRSMIREVALPNLDPKCGNIMMVTSFNEWFEDSQIEATIGSAPTTSKDDSEDGRSFTGGDRYVDYGTLYLDILREEVRR
ncbi:MAG: hypothetical protein RI897_3188 [Verrucomicrobiota bacterium]|jgi:hypothetical protein